MAKRKTDSVAVSAENKIARILALLLIKDVEQKPQQVALLRSAGFEIPEIASLLAISENNVSVALHRQKKK
jgi:hypothetical protein